jgi:hypothetical protein
MRTWIAWSVVTLVAVYSVQAAASNMLQGQLAKLPVQESYRDVTIGRLELWLDAVNRHKPGEADASVGEIRPWGPQEVDELLIDLNTLLVLMRNERTTKFLRPSSGSRPPIPVFYTPPQLDRLRIRARNEKIRNDENRILKRGALLHTDIAAQLPFQAKSIPSEPPVRSQRIMVYFDDGRRLGFENAVEHWRGAIAFRRGTAEGFAQQQTSSGSRRAGPVLVPRDDRVPAAHPALRARSARARVGAFSR